jgi:LysM repeat protein
MSTIPSSADKEVLISEAGQYIQVIVHPGDSLWKIARNHGNKQNDIRKIIYEIKKINQLESSTIHPGQIILMPKN